MHRGIPSCDIAVIQHVLVAVEPSDQAARFTNQHDSCRDVPRPEPHLPERLEVAGGDVREIQRRGTSASNPADTAGDRGKLSQIRLESPQLSKGKSRSD